MDYWTNRVCGKTNNNARLHDTNISNLFYHLLSNETLFWRHEAMTKNKTKNKIIDKKELERLKNSATNESFWEEFTDEELIGKTCCEFINLYLEWEGIIGYSYFLHNAFEAVYEIDLGE